MTGQSAAQPATAELLALAAKSREDIDLDALRDVIAEALGMGKPWSVVMVQTVRIIAHPDEDLWDLRVALKDPLKQDPASRRRTHF